MKTKDLFGILMLFLFTFTFISCDKDTDNRKQIFHLSFEKNYYERPLTGAKDIMIRGGNRDYTIEVNNPEILEATIDLSSPIGMGDLEIHPKQTGETIVKVHDNIVNETVELKIKIVDDYLNLNSNHREVNRQYYPTEQLRQSNAIKKNDSTHKA